MTIPSSPPADEVIVVRERMTRRGCLWRFGCVVLWLPLMLLPLFLFLLATQGEVALWHNASFPSSAEHPFLQVKLLMDIDTRGLNITRSYISTPPSGSDAVCVQTNVRFLLWQGQGEAVDYCDCYAPHDDGSDGWTFVSTNSGLCGG